MLFRKFTEDGVQRVVRKFAWIPVWRETFNTFGGRTVYERTWLWLRTYWLLQRSVIYQDQPDVVRKQYGFKVAVFWDTFAMCINKDELDSACREHRLVNPLRPESKAELEEDDRQAAEAMQKAKAAVNVGLETVAEDFLDTTP